MSEHNTTKQNNDEVDLIEILRYLGNGIKRFFAFIGSVFYNIFALFMMLLIFLSKYMLLLGATIIIGFILFYIAQSQENSFESVAIVHTNYRSEFALKSRLEEYNQLIIKADFKTLADKLEIKLEDAEAFEMFTMDPMFSNNKMRFDYYDFIYETDSTIQKDFSFETYYENLKFEDYKEYEITAVSSKKDVFGKLDQKLWDFSENANLYKFKQREHNLLLRKKEIIKEILDGLDSTKTAERKALLKSIEQTATTNIEVGSNKQFLDHKALYEYEADLTKSLVNAEKSLTNNEELIYVINDFQNVGNSVEDKKKYAYLILPLAITILILLFAQLLKYLKKEETQDSWRFKKL